LGASQEYSEAERRDFAVGASDRGEGIHCGTEVRDCIIRELKLSAQALDLGF